MIIEKKDDVFRDWCKYCKKKVLIRWHPMGTCPGTCENGHCWLSGRKYSPMYENTKNELISPYLKEL